MRERPGQRCLSSGVTSRWRPTRDSTGWKCLQNTLTEENTAALLLSSYCVQSFFCVYFYFAFIYCISCNFFSISFYFFFFFFSHFFLITLFSAQHCSWEVGHPRGGYSTAQPLFGSRDGGTAEQDKGRVIRRKSTNCPPALPFRRKNTALQKEMLKSNM